MSNAKSFGADGNGKTDDTEALQHAVDDGDGVLELSKGTYRITRSIVLDMTKRGFLGVRGEQGTARILMDGPGAALSFIGDHQGTATPKTVKDHTFQKERMPIVSDIEIVGVDPQSDGIRLFRTMQTTIQNTLIRNCRYGIHLAERNRNFLLTSSHIYDCHDTGIFFDECNLHQVIIAANHISYCKRAGIRQWNGDVHNIQITGNDIEYNSGGEGTSGEIVLEAPDGIISEYTIASNTLQATLDATGANVFILGAKEDPPTAVRLVAITGNVLGSRDRNVVIENGSTTTITGNTIYGGAALNVALKKCLNVAIGSNTIATRPAGYSSKSNDGLLLEDCAACSVTGNVMNDTASGDKDAGGAITLRGCDAVGISANQVIDSRFRGIDVIDSSRCRVSDNTVIERRAERVGIASIRVDGKGAGNVIRNNIVTKGSETDVACDQSNGTASDNVVLD